MITKKAKNLKIGENIYYDGTHYKITEIVYQTFPYSCNAPHVRIKLTNNIILYIPNNILIGVNFL